MLITTIPCLADNYAYVIHDNKSKTTGVIDAIRKTETHKNKNNFFIVTQINTGLLTTGI